MVVYHWYNTANQFLDVAQEFPFLLITKGKCNTTCASPARTADPVHIGFRNIGQFIIDHMGKVVNVDSPCSNICCNKYPRSARFKVGQRPLSCIL